MRVNELSKELGKSNKEVLEILQKNHFDVKSHASNITDEQAASVRRSLMTGGGKLSAAEISKSDTGKAETKRVEEIKKEPMKAETKDIEKTAAEKAADAPKKRIAAVYRPQNSVQGGRNPRQGQRPAGQGTGRPAGQGARPAQGAGRPAAQAGTRPAAQTQTAASAQTAPAASAPVQAQSTAPSPSSLTHPVPCLLARLSAVIFLASSSESERKESPANSLASGSQFRY